MVQLSCSVSSFLDFKGDCMKHIKSVMTVFIALSSFTVQGGETNEKEIKCIMHEAMAAEFMRGVQSGVTLSRYLEHLKTSSHRAEYEKIVIEAFKTPRYNDSQLKQNAITDFRNKIMLACIEAKD